MGSHLQSALSQAWPPFILIVGLLAIGHIAGEEGLFGNAATRLVRCGIKADFCCR